MEKVVTLVRNFIKWFNWKRVVLLLVGIVILSVGTTNLYGYVTERKILNGVVSKDLSDKGMPVGMTMFTPEDTVYFTAKGNQFWIKKAEIVWYKGEIDRKNRIHVEKNVALNKEGYFTAKLPAPEGLEEGHYGVTIYVEGSDFMQTRAEFDVIK
ncbi:hypothetical protein DCE79_11555 [Lysinibacillus sp. 2017]|nr:hypothetical protein DCE79_11555 [Lysinibacillus sp. 2017]TGN34898.1 hypothetical protein E4L99_12510 [Lysinibacillus sp. S2017]